MKYNYSRQITTPEGVETFTAIECASFDEAKKFVDRGIHDRKLELAPKLQQHPSTPTRAAGSNSGDNGGDGSTSGNVQNTTTGA